MSRFVTGVVHMVMDTKKSHSLPFVSSRTRKAVGVIHTKSKSLKRDW